MSDLLVAHLIVCVPLRIHELQQEGKDSVFRSLHAHQQEWSQLIAEHGDQVLYRGKDTAKMIAVLVDAIAHLSFCPGGITIFGRHWEGR